MALSSFHYRIMHALVEVRLQQKLTSLVLHEAHKADGLKRVAAVERVKDR